MKTHLWIFPLLFLFSSLASAKTLSLTNESMTPFSGSKLYYPTDGKSHPGILVLHGSEGGSLPSYKVDAQFLAAQGYVVLAYCWYNCAKNPITDAFSPLENVELRDTVKAIQWLKKSPLVGSQKVGLLGFSRGGEEAILMGSINESIVLLDAIAAHTPSDVVVSGFSWSAIDRRCWICSQFDLACFKGSEDFNSWDWPNIHWNLSCGIQPKYPDQIKAWLLDGAPLKVGSVIEIEKFKKPVMITVGDQDELWDYKQSVRIADRLKSFHQPIELHVFPGEHHSFTSENENKRQELLLKFFARTLR